MLATCRMFFEIIFHGSYMRITPQHVSGQRDTCMKILGIYFKCYMLHVENVTELIGENQKGTAGRGRERNVTTICDKRHDNLRHVTTICDIL